MKKFIISLLIVAAFVAIPVSVFASDVSATATGNVASAQILDDISVSNEVPLNFGQLYSSGLTAGGTIIMQGNAAGTLTGTNASAVEANTHSSAQFDVNGSANAAYIITLPTTDVDLTGASTGTVIKLSAFTTDVISPTLNGSGEQTFYVGATLTVPASVPGGDTYTGSYNVTVAYN